MIETSFVSVSINLKPITFAFLGLSPLSGQNIFLAQKMRINFVLYYVTYYVLCCIKAISKVNVILEVSCILVLTWIDSSSVRVGRLGHFKQQYWSPVMIGHLRTNLWKQDTFYMLHRVWSNPFNDCPTFRKTGLSNNNNLLFNCSFSTFSFRENVDWPI